MYEYAQYSQPFHHNYTVSTCHVSSSLINLEVILCDTYLHLFHFNFTQFSMKGINTFFNVVIVVVLNGGKMSPTFRI